MLYIFIFFFGGIIGSFLGVVVERLYNDEVFISGRSYCSSCHHQLVWYDLIPFFSYLGLRGRCRYCRSPIPLFLPLIELVTGAIFLLLFFYLKTTTALFLPIIFFSYILASCLIIIFFSDLKYHLIYDKVIIFAILSVLILQLINGDNLIVYLLSALGAGGCFYLFHWLGPKIFGKPTMGWGDVKLVVLMGLFLGFPGIVAAFYIAFISGALMGVILIALKKIKMKSEVPFGCFLVSATFAVWFWGDQLINLFEMIFIY